MSFTHDASCFRAVVKNTFVHIQQLGDNSDEKRMRRKSDTSCIRHLVECPMFFGNGPSCVIEVESSPRITKEDGNVCMEGSCFHSSINNENTFVYVEEADRDSCESIQHRRQSRMFVADLLDQNAEPQYYTLVQKDTTSQESQTVIEASSTQHDARHSQPEISTPLASVDRDRSTSVGGAGIAPQESVGSREHFQGLCRPCAHFWRPTSCSKGADCEFCHLCDEAAVARAVASKQVAWKQKRNAQGANEKQKA